MLAETIIRSLKHRNVMSQIFRFPEAVPKEKIAGVVHSKSFKLMLSHGFIAPVSPGIYTLLPIAVRSVQKLCELIDIMMQRVSAQKVLYPTLIQESLMKKSGRWENSGLFKLKDRNSFAYCLGPTHEEIATKLLSKLRVSYKLFPLRFYQISSKFRDEMNPRLGLIRGREFIMKDMYSFDCDEEKAKLTYETMCDLYSNFFQLLGIECIKVKGSSGDIGGTSSHEYHVLSDIGEDQVLYCPKCKSGINMELFTGKENKCSTCNMDYRKGTAIEVGHAFLLGTTYSKTFEAEYNSSNSVYKTLHMGCYGLGVTRILAACAECLSTPDKLRWPSLIAPYLLSVIIPKSGSREESVTPFAEYLYESLNKIDWLSSNIVIDERSNLTIGKRVNDAVALGIPYITVVSSSALEEIPKIEIIDVYNDKTFFLTHKETMDFFRNRNELSVSFNKHEVL